MNWNNGIPIIIALFGIEFEFQEKKEKAGFEMFGLSGF